MAILLDRPPTKPQPLEERQPEAPPVTACDDVTEPLLRWWWHLSLHDRVAALMLAIGEYGALAHGAAWAAVLGLLTDHGKHGEQPEAHVARHAVHD
jgi:hypothetical protein